MELAGEGFAFCGALHFNQFAIGSGDDIHVDFGGEVFFVIEIEQEIIANLLDIGVTDIIVNRNIPMIMS